MIRLGRYIIKYNKFPNGELHIPIDDILESYNNAKYYNIDWQYNGNNLAEEWQVIKFLKRTIDEKGGRYGILKMPYIPYSRMDRNEGGKIFSLKYFAEELNNLNFYRVEVLDPHSTVAEALINNIQISNHRDTFDWEFRKNFTEERECRLPLDVQLVFPDNGANKKYQNQYQDLIQHPPAVGTKIRDWETGKIKEITVDGINRLCSIFIIVDDICSRGGTFLGVAEKIREKVPNAKIYLYVTHLEETAEKGILQSDLIDGIVATNSMGKISNSKISYTGVI